MTLLYLGPDFEEVNGIPGIIELKHIFRNPATGKELHMTYEDVEAHSTKLIRAGIPETTVANILEEKQMIESRLEARSKPDDISAPGLLLAG